MPSFSIADLWEETSRFVRREVGLLLPTAFATIGLGALLFDLAAPATPAGQQPAPGPWMIVLPPIALLLLIGNLALTALALRPGGSVRDAFALAFRRLPRAILVALLMVAVLSVLMILLGIVAVAIGAAARWSPMQAASLLMMLALPVVVWAGVRLILLWPVLIERPDAGPLAAIRIAFAASRGRVARLLGAVLIYALGYILILMAVQIGLGSAVMLAGRATGQMDVARLVLAIVVALLGAALQGVWTVFVARLYLRIGSASSGI